MIVSENFACTMLPYYLGFEKHIYKLKDTLNIKVSKANKRMMKFLINFKKDFE